MSATFTWVIQRMTIAPQLDGQTDVVVEAIWACQGVESANNGEYKSSQEGTAYFPVPQQGGSFTPYDQLTQSQVLGWVWQTVSQSETESIVQANLNAAINPVVTILPLPWASPTA
jgi:hypothetical protein